MTLIVLMLLAHAAMPAWAGPIQPLLDRLVKEERLPGAVLLVSGPEGRQIAAAGVANRQTLEPMTPHTRFYIASSGKLVTATMALQLVQEGRLGLSDPVLPWVSDIEGITGLRNIRVVTLEQLLKHRSGLPANRVRGWRMGTPPMGASA